MLAKFAGILTRDNVLFSLRSFAAACTSLYIAFDAQLDEPSWAFMTAYIVSQPLAGQMASKSLYRFVGTFTGAVMSLAFTGMFAQAGPFFVLCVSSWIALCTFLSSRLRGAPYSYVFALSGYTTAIIGFTEAMDPSNAFNVAQTRFLEISLGIFCSTFFHLVFFPNKAGEKLAKSLDKAVEGAAQLTEELLKGGYDPKDVEKKLASVVESTESFAFMRLYARYDTPNAEKLEPTVIYIESRMADMVTALSSWHALIQRDSNQSEFKGDATKHAEAVRDFLIKSLETAKGENIADLGPPTDALLKRLEGALPAADAVVANMDSVAYYAAIERLIELTTIWRDVIVAYSHYKAETPYVLSVRGPKIRRYHDNELALVSAGVSFVSLIAAWMFWYATAWPSGSSAISFAAILVTLMAPLDDPRKGSRVWFPMGVLAGVVALFYLFVIFQRLSAFPELVLAIAPYYVLAGIIMATKKGSGLATAAITMSAAMISFDNQMDYNFASTVNSIIAILVGVLFAVAGFALLRPLGEDWTLRRVRRSIYETCADLLVVRHPPNESIYKSLMIDRINDVLSRVDMSNAKQERLVKGSLAGLLIGANTLVLRSVASQLPPDAAAKVKATMMQFVPLLRAHGNPGDVPKRDYLGLLDAARHDLEGRTLSQPILRAIASLAEIRGMFRSNAEFFGLPVENSEPKPSASGGGASSPPVPSSPAPQGETR